MKVADTKHPGIPIALGEDEHCKGRRSQLVRNGPPRQPGQKIHPSPEDLQGPNSASSLLTAHSPQDPKDPLTKVDDDEGIQELVPKKLSSKVGLAERRNFPNGALIPQPSPASRPQYNAEGRWKIYEWVMTIAPKQLGNEWPDLDAWPKFVAFLVTHNNVHWPSR